MDFLLEHQAVGDVAQDVEPDVCQPRLGITPLNALCGFRTLA
jgi:hypothetical protein